MTSDPNSWIQASAKTLAETLTSKNSDYAPTGEFSTFEEAADFAGVTSFDVMMSQLGIKVTRIKVLLDQPKAENEPLSDSLLDLAGYAVIAHAYITANGHPAEPDEPDQPKYYKFQSVQSWNPAG